MSRRPPSTTRSVTLLPYPTLFRSFAGDDAGGAGGADAGFSGIRGRETRGAGAVEDVAGLGVERHPALPAVEGDLHGEAPRLVLEGVHLGLDGGGRAIRREALDVYLVLVDAALQQCFLGRVHHRAGAADEEAGDVLGLDQMREDFLTFCAVEHAVEERSEEHTSELQSLMRISYAV